MKKFVPLTIALLIALPLAAQSVLPASHRELTKSTSYAEMQQFLESVDGKGPVKVSAEGTSTKGRSIPLVRLSHTETPAWKILFYAQQHGDEISGKDALLYLIRDVAANPDLLPADTAVWIVPMVNPDGAEAGTRVNGAGVDLNRDHMTLEQPETQMLHRLAQRIRPDVAVDCHEFARDSESWRKRGWAKWPDITMDRLVNPLFAPELTAIGDRWLAAAAQAEQKAGHPFFRYTVGGRPPDDEQRHSAPDLDSAMNAMAAYGALSFIIEAAARKDDIPAELGSRVDAYLALVRMIVGSEVRTAGDLEAIRRARERTLPPFLPVNYFWANPAAQVSRFPVLVLATGARLEVPTANLMTDVVVKKTVPTPDAYAIEPRAAAAFRSLLDRHGIGYETVAVPRRARVERCTLLRVEDDFDDVYSRYEGRQIVAREAVTEVEVPPGTLLVPLHGALAADAELRAALLLEPTSLYGLYQYPTYRQLAGESGALPVMRLMRWTP